jgi:RNA polymerase sigma-70 factor (ECF subfamily)
VGVRELQLAAEAAIREHHRRAEWDAAVTLALREYGAEIFGFLIATLRSDEAAAEVFSRFSLDLWSGIAAFEWRSSFRTWAYALARHASLRFVRDPFAERARPLSQEPGLAQLEAKLRSETAPFLKSEAKSRVALLRQRLHPHDQALLILRVDKGLEWEEVARILGDTPTPSEDRLRRRAAALRKRFERVKAQLRKMAEELGGEG